MTLAARHVPQESDVLCEHCGYTLNGLPENGLCPECGKPAADSAASLRRPSDWENPAAPGGPVVRFMRTTAAALCRPTYFFRNLQTRLPQNSRAAAVFAHVHWIAFSALVGWAGVVHYNWLADLGALGGMRLAWGGWFGLSIASYLTVWGLNLLAARLTAWEAAYRGYRLPRPVVIRGLHYHAAHYLPVALAAVAVVLGGQRFLIQSGGGSGLNYLYTLSGVVILSAVYLFMTYWTAMKNMLYANG